MESLHAYITFSFAPFTTKLHQDAGDFLEGKEGRYTTALFNGVAIGSEDALNFCPS